MILSSLLSHFLSAIIAVVLFAVIVYKTENSALISEALRWRISRRFIEKVLIKSEERRKAGLSFHLTETNIACLTQVCGLLSIGRLSEILEGVPE